MFIVVFLLSSHGYANAFIGTARFFSPSRAFTGRADIARSISRFQKQQQQHLISTLPALPFQLNRSNAFGPDIWDLIGRISRAFDRNSLRSCVKVASRTCKRQVGRHVLSSRCSLLLAEAACARVSSARYAREFCVIVFKLC